MSQYASPSSNQSGASEAVTEHAANSPVQPAPQPPPSCPPNLGSSQSQGSKTSAATKAPPLQKWQSFRFPHENPLRSLLKSETVGSLLTGNPVISVHGECSLEDVVLLLRDNEVQSVLVVTDKGQPLGFIDALDIVRLLVAVYPDALDDGSAEDASAMLRALTDVPSAAATPSHVSVDSLTSISSLVSAGSAKLAPSPAQALARSQTDQLLRSLPCRLLVDASARNPLFFVTRHSPVSMLAELFSQGFRRAAVLGDPMQVVTQTDVLCLLHSALAVASPSKSAAGSAHARALRRVFKQSLVDLGFESTPVVSVDRDRPVREAFEKLSRSSVSAVAVVNPANGRLIGNFSASDLDGLFDANSTRMVMSDSPNISAQDHKQMQDEMPSLSLSSVSSVTTPHSLSAPDLRTPSISSRPVVISLSSFDVTVEEYLARHSPGALKPVVGAPTSSLGAVVKALVVRRLHRLWIVKDRKAVGIISLGDIMKIASRPR